jgi:hypothetical protein
MTFLENIKQKNQFPIIFIGSGITKRYFKMHRIGKHFY